MLVYLNRIFFGYILMLFGGMLMLDYIGFFMIAHSASQLVWVSKKFSKVMLFGYLLIPFKLLSICSFDANWLSVCCSAIFVVLALLHEYYLLTAYSKLAEKSDAVATATNALNIRKHFIISFTLCSILMIMLKIYNIEQIGWFVVPVLVLVIWLLCTAIRILCLLRDVSYLHGWR